jgi:hypothetical protein
MRIVRRDHRALLVIGAVLVLASAWLAMGEQSTAAPRDLPAVGHLAHESRSTMSSVDVGDVTAAPAVAVTRTAEPRSAPLWVLPGLAAALAALCLLRLQRGAPLSPARRVLLRGSVANRAPPLASFA